MCSESHDRPHAHIASLDSAILLPNWVWLRTQLDVRPELMALASLMAFVYSGPRQDSPVFRCIAGPCFLHCICMSLVYLIGSDMLTALCNSIWTRPRSHTSLVPINHNLPCTCYACTHAMLLTAYVHAQYSTSLLWQMLFCCNAIHIVHSGGSCSW